MTTMFAITGYLILCVTAAIGLKRLDDHLTTHERIRARLNALVLRSKLSSIAR